LLNSTFGFLNTINNLVDFIIYTGDTARHDRDSGQARTINDVLSDHATVIRYFTDNFNVSNVKFIPTIGNNDMFVREIEASGPDSFLSNLSSLWNPFNLNLGDAFNTGGYFVQDVIPGKLQVISANTMFFSKKNTAVPDCNVASGPGAIELVWLKTQLQAARNGNYNVYIIGHMAPTDDLGAAIFYPNCFTQYVNLLGSYSDVIVGHFNGHTNADSVAVIVQNANSTNSYSYVPLTPKGLGSLDLSQTPIVMVLNNAPSVIPFNNPAVRVYKYDTRKHHLGELQDYAQYYANLTTANLVKSVEYKLEYVYSEAYKQSGLGINDWTTIINGFQVPNSVSLQNYNSFEYVQPTADWWEY